MAEIVPLILLFGSLYVISNKEKNKENLSNMQNRKMIKNDLPNSAVNNINYKSIQHNNENIPIDSSSKNYIQQYPNSNQTTDKLFNSNYKNENINSNEINSLSGNKISHSDFNHNNMVPFFGSKVKGPRNNTNMTESILDNSQGAGTHISRKVESAPLFKPEDNIQWSNGVPNNNDFYQSRQLPSNKISNVLPWEQEKVGPGLGLGYTTSGSGGFNSGMMDRTSWISPTVDELRVKTNPKLTYHLAGHEGPAQSEVKNLGFEGAVEKNRPDTDYSLGPERWFTTTGNSIGQTIQSKQLLSDTNRITTTNEYYGVGGNDGDSKASYLKGHYEDSIRQNLGQTNITPVSAQGHGIATESDYGIKGFDILTNNRQANCPAINNGNIGGMNGTFKAMVAPIIDILRPSRKENIIGNPNPAGNITSLVPNLPITNPSDKVKTTIKETTVDKVGLNHLNVSHISVPDGGYKSTNLQVKEQKRNMADSSTIGFVGGPSTMEAQMSVSAWDNQHNNVNKTYENWPMPGGTSLFNQNTNIEIAKRDYDRENNRTYNKTRVIPEGNSVTGIVPSLETYGKINMPQQYNQQMNSDRMNPEILTAFKTNPYAQSLNSY